MCVRVCVHWNGHACWVASWLRTCWGEAALDEEREETGRRRRDEGNENRCVLMCVCVCCRVCFFVRVRCCCFHCESMSSIINTARWPFPRGRSAVYLSDTISSYTQNPRADATATATRRQCRQRGMKFEYVSSGNWERFSPGLTPARITRGTNFTCIHPRSSSLWAANWLSRKPLLGTGIEVGGRGRAVSRLNYNVSKYPDRTHKSTHPPIHISCINRV